MCTEIYLNRPVRQVSLGSIGRPSGIRIAQEIYHNRCSVRAMMLSCVPLGKSIQNAL
jgi:hypothetical protein